MARRRRVVYCYITWCTSHDIHGTSTLATPPGDVGPLSSLHVSDQQGWWWPHLAVKATAGD